MRKVAFPAKTKSARVAMGKGFDRQRRRDRKLKGASPPLVCVCSLSALSIHSALITCNNLASVCVLQEVGSIIGKKGEIVKRFREEVSVFLKSPEKEENGASALK